MISAFNAEGLRFKRNIIANTAFEKHLMVFAVMKLFNWMDIPHTVNYCCYPMTHLKTSNEVNELFE